MKKIYFLILNYKTKNETENCINTIQKLEITGYEVNIVVIDNASGDDSYEYLKKLYVKDEKTEIYQMESNMGFSKANNYGYSLIRNRGDYAFIIVCNSDIEFCQNDFLIRLLQEYRMTQFHMMGPCVYCESNKTNFCRGYQSPAYPHEWKKWYVILREKAYSIKLKKINHITPGIIERLLGGVYVN